jgi:hypothetical protein
LGRIDPCIYSLRALRDVIIEDRNLHGEALRGRAFARHSLQKIANALEGLDAKTSDIDIANTLSRWLNRIGKPEMMSEAPNKQSLYTLDCAKLCHTEAEISENRRIRSILIDLVTILVAFAEWLDMYPPEEKI